MKYRITPLLETLVIEAESADEALDIAYSLTIEEWGKELANCVTYTDPEREG